MCNEYKNDLLVFGNTILQGGLYFVECAGLQMVIFTFHKSCFRDFQKLHNKMPNHL